MRNVNTLRGIINSGTVISSDTAEYEDIAQYDPVYATTNPSLVFQAISKEKYAHVVETAIRYALEKGGKLEDQVEVAMDRALVEVGRKLIEIIPGRVSVSLDTRLAHHEKAMVKKSLAISRIFSELNIPSSRFLLKVPATWEGIQAARTLMNKYDLQSNMTLIFGRVQAQACAEAGLAIISPYVGRVLDWHKEQTGLESVPIHEHPGVLLVQDIKRSYLASGAKTKIMAAGFRHMDEIMPLAGVDYMTLPPSHLESLRGSTKPVESFVHHNVSPKQEPRHGHNKGRLIDDEEAYRRALAEEKIALVKVEQGLEKFSVDVKAMEDMFRDRISLRR